MKTLLELREINTANFRTPQNRKDKSYLAEDVDKLIKLLYDNTELAYKELQKTKNYRDLAEEYSKEKANLKAGAEALTRLKDDTLLRAQKEIDQKLHNAKIEAERIIKDATITATRLKKQAEDEITIKTADIRSKHEDATRLSTTAQRKYEELVKKGENEKESLIKSTEFTVQAMINDAEKNAQAKAEEIIEKAIKEAESIRLTAVSEANETITTAQNKAEEVMQDVTTKAKMIAEQADVIEKSKNAMVIEMLALIGRHQKELKALSNKTTFDDVKIDKAQTQKELVKVGDVLNQSKKQHVPEKPVQTKSFNDEMAKQIIEQYNKQEEIQKQPEQSQLLFTSPDEILKYTQNLK